MIRLPATPEDASVVVQGVGVPRPEDILRIARRYPDGGGYAAASSGPGTPHRIERGHFRLLPSSNAGTYCSGFTFAVAMTAIAELGVLAGEQRHSQWARFQKEWYGAVDAEDVREQQCGLALANLGIGGPIPLAAAEPGDFVQLWRGSTGHSAIFLGWIVRGGALHGLRYRSSQRKTDGIGDAEELFRGFGDGAVDPSRTYFARFGRRG